MILLYPQRDELIDILNSGPGQHQSVLGPANLMSILWTLSNVAWQQYEIGLWSAKESISMNRKYKEM